MRIAILALEGSVLSAIAGLADLFWITNKAIAASPAHAIKFPEKTFETLIVSADGAPVWDTEGRLIHIDSSFQGAGQPDVVIAPGMLLGPDLQPLNLADINLAATWFRKMYDNGALVAASGTGGVVLGEAGLLKERSYATTWWVSHMLQERYPDAIPARGKMLEEDRGVLTTGGCFSWISLALNIIEKAAGTEVANLTSEMSLTDNHFLRQHLSASPGSIHSGTPFLVRAEEIIRMQNPSINAAQLASALNTTERTLQRKFKALSQETPKEFITRVRIETACTMLISTRVSIRQIARDCGYSEETAFRKAFNQIMEMSPAQYRQWMAARASDHRS
ncbi:Transcriptional regulator, AraC family [Pantoea sp. AS-PWVM4]|uniref:GlxA family transcriptional regulator n=1 Tax=Pantoea sp. AS-PWVM4 TaxID=1332069 RepID=UPI0003AC62F1|nr:helix-turn-helix domain-containing protein [Pantoea sp. AS-PWVM4]ERK08998.1 Transcriptional regulator, AraC family [Pantoea sp. AS-PWVM4]